MGQFIDSLSTALLPAQTEALARLLGDTPEATDRAMAAAVPAILAALANRAATGGMDEVMALAGPLLTAGDPQEQLAEALADSSLRGRMMEQGHALIDGLLGDGAGPLAAALSRLTGTRAHTVSEVLKLAGPAGLGVVARQLGGEATADRLSALLQDQRAPLLAALSPQVAQVIGRTAAEPVPLHGTAVEGAAGAAQSAARWLPWLAAAVVAIVLVASFRAFEPNGRPPNPRPETAAIITEGPVRLSPVSLPDGSLMMLPEGSAALELARALSGNQGAGPRGFRFGELGWSAAANRLDSTGEEAVRAVASVLKAWPAAKVRIEAHGDGTGDPAASLTETRARAQAVADLLVADGIPAANVSAAGVGGTQPIATVDTAEGRAQNRRTLVILTAS